MSTQSDPLKVTAQELPFKYKHLVVSGCSFSTGTSSINLALSDPKTWAHWLLQKIHFDRYANLAMPGGGNFAAALNLIYYLDTQYCDPDDTMVIFNLAEFDWVDTICPSYHPNSNPYFSWAEPFHFSWITEGGFPTKKPPFYGELQKNIGYDQTIVLNSLIVMALFSFLEERGYRYYFMSVSQRCFDQVPGFLREKIQQDKARFIEFPGQGSMKEYVADLGLTVSDKDHHPSAAGHKKISEVIFGKIMDDC